MSIIRLGGLMSTTGNITEGHILFHTWAIKYGEENKANNPTGKTMKRILHEMNKGGYGIKGYKYRQVYKSLYYYLRTSKTPATPSKASRTCIEFISHGEVPIGSWDEVAYNIGRINK